MKTRAAVLQEMGVAPPYAETKPLVIREVELDPPGRWTVPLGSFGHQRGSPPADADGPRP
jgi:hypothetical protein